MARLIDSFKVGPNGRANFTASPQLSNFWGGDWQDVPDTGSLAIPDPLGASNLAFMPRSAARECELVAAQMDQFRTGTHHLFSREDWVRVMSKFAVILRNQRCRLAALIRREFPTSKEEAYAEIDIAIRFAESFDFMRLRRLHPFFSRNEGVGMGNVLKSGTHFFPRGRVNIVTPFNYPLEIILLHLIGALVCGNVVAAKTHELCGMTAVAIIELLLEAGVPPEFISLLHGYGPEVQDFTIESASDILIFTGSYRTYDRIRGNHTRGELSGANYGYALPIQGGEDVAGLGQSAARGAFGRNKQRCSSLAFLVTDDTGLHSWEEAGLLGEFKEYAGNTYTFGDEGMLPPLLSWTNEQVAAEIEALEAVGAKRLWGGISVSEYNYQPPASAPEGRFAYGCVTPCLMQIDAALLKDPAVAEVVSRERFCPIVVHISITSDDDREIVHFFLNHLPHRLTCALSTTDELLAYGFFSQVRPHGVVNLGTLDTTRAPEWREFGPFCASGGLIGGDDDSLRTMYMGGPNVSVWATPV